MLISHVRQVRFRRADARLYVLRNNGFCWGRVIGADGEQFDVFTRRDWYDRCDTDALDAFERAMRNPKCIEPAEAGLLS